ncbi:myeloid-associated differentiation marker-like protein 2 [Chanos chanos]|uniref:Myeloid-associated differentiation marker-like protein 2 n=1 Tax=Chanos chanos TaxID=29144 RepID=A0A6J2UZH5_CHACN|nr:myeloid-associated differentiation marker-like protein 2 [Chanos chanos]
MDELQFTPSSLLKTRGFLHLGQILTGLLTFIVSGLWPQPLHTYWVYYMIIWLLCPLITLVITVVELFLIHIFILPFCMDWDDFTTGMAMMCALTTFACTVSFAVFYVCLTCVWGLVVSVLSALCCLLYCVEAVRDKMNPTRSASYVAAPPGFLKILEAFVSCIIFVSLTGYVNKPALQWCIVAYVIPFPIIPVIIVTNIMKKLKNCLPFSVDRFVVIFLIISVALYTSAAILWPAFSFHGNPRPLDCPGKTCIWNIQFIVAFMTYVNLIFFIVDLVCTLLGICGFKRP